MVTVDHVCADSRGRTALVLTEDGPRAVTPDDAADGLFGGTYLRQLCTRSDLMDDGLVPGRDGHLDGRTVEVCTTVAAYLNNVLTESDGDRAMPKPEPTTIAPPSPRPAASATAVQSGKTAPVVIWDVDNVLNPRVPTPAHQAHHYDGPGPLGTQVSGEVYLNPEHGAWIAELTDAGATHAWATSWGQVAADWIGQRLGVPAASGWPVIDVGPITDVRWGWTSKARPVQEFLGPDRPLFWLDDLFGGKEHGWAEDRTARGVPTVIRRIDSPAGLARTDIDAALAWLTAVRAAAPGADRADATQDGAS